MLKPGTITTHRQLLTPCWADEVSALDEAVRGFARVRDVKNDCGVMFFEMDGDRALHVNVTHRHRTATAKGWSGPGQLEAGYVHNRTFTGANPDRIVREIRAMVFAPRLKVTTK